MTKKQPAIVSPARQKLRCAVYTRKSSEEGLEMEFNSLEAQRESCEAYVASQRTEGWVLVADRYDDGGFSGGTLDRPALKRLLADIEADVIVFNAFFPETLVTPRVSRPGARLRRDHQDLFALGRFGCVQILGAASTETYNALSRKSSHRRSAIGSNAITEFSRQRLDRGSDSTAASGR